MLKCCLMLLASSLLGDSCCLVSKTGPQGAVDFESLHSLELDMLVLRSKSTADVSVHVTCHSWYCTRRLRTRQQQ
ncbi:uncharacterized protein YALI1_E21786g [Yarrowia lipolytica]|uniref:Secreted protein n=1 Tax=Yarrowia lipolytica TaxID=4952 RepID=A0A1D8NIZ5_YARLL|nr:hypothetical protein YALI1_E21786g [Yarrowia lipolytica]